MDLSFLLIPVVSHPGMAEATRACLVQPLKYRYAFDVCRTTLELLKATYFSDEAANGRSQPAFSKLEVLYVQSKNDTEEVVQQYREMVAECGFELTTVNMEQAFEGSHIAIDIDSPGG